MRWLLLGLLITQAAAAQTVVPTRTIRANALITEQDVTLRGSVPRGEVYALHQVVGREARVTLYADRPISERQIGEASVIERNQMVLLTYGRAGLWIETDGRSLARAAVGERLRVMNLASKSIVIGTVQVDGRVQLGE